MPIGYAYFTIGMIALIVFVPYLRHEYFGRIVSILAYRRGFLNVACPRGKAMRRPGYVGQVTDTDSHARTCICFVSICKSKATLRHQA